MRRLAMIPAVAGLAMIFAACTAAPAEQPTATAGTGAATATPGVTVTPPGEALESPQLPYEAAQLRGTWDYTLDDAGRELILENFAGLVESADEVVTRFGFDGNQWWQGFLFDGELFLLDGVPEGDGGSFAFEEDLLLMYGAHGEARVAYEWMIEGDSLSLTAVEECSMSGSQMSCVDDPSEMDPVMLLVTNQTFTRSGDDPSYSSSDQAAEPHPDGRIAFGREVERDLLFGQIVALYAVDPDGSNLVKLTDGDSAMPAWSPDGTRLAFGLRMDDGSWQIATIAPDGGDLQVLTSGPGIHEIPSWAPDGSWIAYGYSPNMPDDDTFHTVIYRMDADGSNTELLGSPDTFDVEARVSPDGTRVVFARLTFEDDDMQATLMVRDIASGED
jgi:hypothetical protein